ncbi:hypothetical protein BGX28_007076 [Mortierella sp. GBA30]|nr:hypothetical protein BGX28_007076 [Mortierella sp. GBA30]
MAMLPRSSNLYPLLLLQNSKNKHRKHHQPSRRHQSSLSDDSSIDSNNRHDDSLGINDTASESEPYVTGIERDSEYDREEEAEQGQGEEQDPEQASNAGSLRHWHEFDDDDDDESGFEPDSESDGSDTSLTLDDHPITNGISPDPSVPLHVLREQSTQRLAQAWLDIFERYGKEPSELPPDDEIDLATGELIVDNGVLRSHSQTLFGTLTKLGEDIKRPLKQERLRMRRKIHAITNAASHLKSGSRGRRIGSAEEKMWIKPVSNKARKNHMKGEITYGGDDFDNLLYIPTPSSAAFSDNSNASQPQQKEMEPQETEDRSCAVVEQEHNTHVPEPEGDNSEDVYDDDQDEYEQEQEHEDEENEGEAEDTGHEKEEDEEDEENYYRVEEDNKEDEEQEHYPVRPSAFVSGSIESQGRQETNQEASEDEGYPDEEGGRSSDVDDPVRARNSFDSSRPEDVSTYVTHRPVLSDTQPFSIRNSMSTVKATWDSTGMRSSLTWAASPIAGASVVEYSNYSNAEEAYEDKEEHAQDDDDIHHKPEMRSDNRWSPPLTGQAFFGGFAIKRNVITIEEGSVGLAPAKKDTGVHIICCGYLIEHPNDAVA